MLAQIPARALETEAEAEAEREEREAALERYTDCVGRAVLAEIIVVGGDKVGAVVMRVGGEMIEFGYKIWEAARRAAGVGGGVRGEEGEGMSDDDDCGGGRWID